MRKAVRVSRLRYEHVQEQQSDGRLQSRCHHGPGRMKKESTEPALRLRSTLNHYVTVLYRAPHCLVVY